MIPRPPNRRLARRLLVANGLVIVAGAVTLAVVALLVSPPVFHRHVAQALGPVTDAVGRHLDEALFIALVLSLGVGVSAAVLAALAVSWVLSSRIARPIEDLAGTAERLASGDLSARAARPPADDELADLTAAFNEMATALERTEATRRQLLSDAAHELRTPLSTIEGYVEGLTDGVVRPDDQTWATLRDATSRLRRLIDDVALVSRAEEHQLELAPRPVAVADLVATAVNEAREACAREGISLRSDVADPSPMVEVDPDRAQQVLANLLDNARRHTPDGGLITVRAERVDDAVVVAVEDTGEGIAPDHLAHVFERFYRGDASRRSGTGSGVGLTIARAIARAHGGDLTASSPGAGQGSRFRWRVPVGSRADR